MGNDQALTDTTAITNKIMANAIFPFIIIFSDLTKGLPQLDVLKIQEDHQ